MRSDTLGLLIFSEPLSGWQAGLYLFSIFIVTIVLLVVGAFVLIRALAAVVNSQRDSWESIAGPLRLKVEPVGTPPYRVLSGEQNGRTFLVSYYGIPRGESGSYPAASVEVPLIPTVPFSFRIEKPEMLYQKIADKFFADAATGHHFFDEAFRVSTSDSSGLGRLLDAQAEGEGNTLLNDLLIIEKDHDRVIVTENSVVLGRRSDLGNSSGVGKIIDRAVYLADRILSSASV